MKKTISLTVFVLSLTALKAQTSDITTDLQNVQTKFGRITGVISEGNAYKVADNNGREIKVETPASGGNYFVGMPVEYIEFETPAGIKTRRLGNESSNDAG